MSAPPATRQPAPRSALRRLVARHPVAAFLIMVYTVNTAVALVPVLTRRDILPFGLAPYESLGPIFGVTPLNALLSKWELLFTYVLPQLVLLIVFFIVAEEIGFMGFLQARLQERYVPLKASVIVTLPFAL